MDAKPVNHPPFRFLSLEDFQALTGGERFPYLMRAIEEIKRRRLAPDEDVPDPGPAEELPE